MSRKNDITFKTPHHRAYFAAALLIVAGVLAVGVTAVLFFDVGADPEEAEMYRLAAVWIPLHFMLKWLTARPVAGTKLSEEWQETLTSIVPFGLVVAIFTKAETTTLWAGLCQVIGGWVVITTVLLLSNLAFDAGLRRVKAYRQEKRHAD